MEEVMFCLWLPSKILISTLVRKDATHCMAPPEEAAGSAVEEADVAKVATAPEARAE